MRLRDHGINIIHGQSFHKIQAYEGQRKHSNTPKTPREPWDLNLRIKKGSLHTRYLLELKVHCFSIRFRLCAGAVRCLQFQPHALPWGVDSVSHEHIRGISEASSDRGFLEVFAPRSSHRTEARPKKECERNQKRDITIKGPLHYITQFIPELNSSTKKSCIVYSCISRLCIRVCIFVYLLKFLFFVYVSCI